VSVLLGLADDGISEHDLDLLLERFAGDRLETCFLRCGGVAADDVVFKPSHQHQQPYDDDGPCNENAQQQQLIGSHPFKCRRA
jgi:hypothetical protein